MEISIIIPIYNAERLIENSIGRITNYLPKSLDYEIVLRDDCSKDRSREVIKEISEKYDNVRYTYNDKNRGLGYTLKQLFNDAKGQYLIYLDVDLPFGENIIPRIVKEIKRYDIVLVSRYTKDIYLSYKQPTPLRGKIKLIRRVLSYIYYRICKKLFDIPIRDIGSGTVAINRKVVNELDIKSDGFDFHIEFYVKAYRHQFTIKELTAVTQFIERGTFKILKHGSQIIFNTIKIWLELRDYKAPSPKAKVV